MSTSRQSGRNRKSVTPSTAKAQAAVAPVVPAESATGPYSWTHDYDYVKKDLRKLGIVSVVLFAAIIVAGFFV